MKKKLHIAVVAFLTMAACTNDLDVEPLDPTVSTANRVYADAANYQKALDKIYSVWALSGQDGAGGSDISDLDAGNTVLFRSWFTLQEQTTDEMKNSWGDPWCLDVNGILWSTTKCEPIEGVYQRCMFIVALTNEYLKTFRMHRKKWTRHVWQPKPVSVEPWLTIPYWTCSVFHRSLPKKTIP